MPSCPQFYTCTFTPQKAHTVYVNLSPWYEKTAGWIVALIAVLVLAVAIGYIASLIADAKEDRRKREALEKERKHKMAIEEQRTMQIDSAKGDPAVLRIVQEMQKGY